jgi:RNA polymerase sigma factor (sigma-70 family)
VALINYEFNYLAGGVSAIAVDEKWAAILRDMDHEEALNERRETRHRLYVNTTRCLEDRFVSPEPDPLQVICGMESFVELMKKADTLTPRQLEVLAHRLRGMSQREIAESLGVSQSTVRDVIEHIRKKLSADTTQNGIPEAIG